MRYISLASILMLASCRFAAALDLKTASRMFGMEPVVCAHILMVAPKPIADPSMDPLTEPFTRMLTHVRAQLTKIENLIAAHTPIPREIYEMLLDPKRTEDRLEFLFGDEPDRSVILSAARGYFYHRYLGRGYLEYKMNGRLVEYTDDTWSIVPPTKAGRYDALVNDLMLTEQRTLDLIRAQPGYRSAYRERRRTTRPGTTEVLDFSEDAWVQRREIFSFNLDPANLPSELKDLKQMTFSTYTEDHSFSHFAQSTKLESLTDALALARDTVTTVVSTRLTSHDIFQLLHLLVMASKVPVEVNLEGWAKNKAHGRPMLPVRLRFPSGGDPKAQPFEIGLVICTAPSCRVKDLDFKAGEIVSAFPISGPGVVRIPPARDLRRALVHGQTLFNEADFTRPASQRKILEPQ